MALSFRRIFHTTLISVAVFGVCDICYGDSPNNKQVAVIDLGEPGVQYAYFQETEELSEGKLKSVTWLGPQSEDAFLVIDTAALEEKGWALEHPKTGVRLKGHVLVQTHVAVRKPNENRRTYTGLLGMLQAFDENRDKRISLSDFIYPILGLYRDRNGDGLVDPSEISSLADSGVAEIVLVVKGGTKRDEHGNQYQVIKVKKTDDSMTDAQLVRLRVR